MEHLLVYDYTDIMKNYLFTKQWGLVNDVVDLHKTDILFYFLQQHLLNNKENNIIRRRLTTTQEEAPT